MTAFFYRFVRSVVYSNVFIGCCTVLMTWQSLFLFAADTIIPSLYGFVFAGTLCSYSFHWWLTPPDAGECSGDRGTWLKRHRSLHYHLLIISIAASIYFAYALRDHWYWVLAAGAITFLYSAPKIRHPLFSLLQRIAIGKTLFLSIMWTFVTTVFPILVTDTGWSLPFFYFTLSRFFLIYAICILFDYRDRELDKARQIKSLITYLPPSSIRRLFIFSLLLCLLFTLLPATRLPFMTIAFQLTPVIILAGIFNYSRHKAGDLFFYFFLDGLMALSALLLLVQAIVSGGGI